MKCDVCGIESKFEAVFVKQRKSFRRSRRVLCPSCWVRRRDRRGIRFLVVMLGMGALGYGLLWFKPGHFLGILCRNLFLIDLFLVISIVPHELGHATVARLLGWRVFQIVLGVGKPILKWRWRGVLIDLRWLPMGGVTVMAPCDGAWFRLKRFLSVLAGPAVNAGMVATVFTYYQGQPGNWNFFALPYAALLFAWANVWVLVINLWPHTSKESLRLPTDGKQLLNSLSRKHAGDLLALRFVYEATACRERKDFPGAREWCDRGLAAHPDNIHLLNMAGVNHLDLQNYVQAREIFHRLLASEKQASPMTSIFMNNIAYADALAEHPDWLAEADTFSRGAYAQLPWMPAIVGTRGTVLLALGQTAEAITLLRKSFEEAESPVGKAENACHLAIAHASENKLDEATRYLDIARKLNPDCPVLARAETQVLGSKSAVSMPAN